jgi:hypothetical protein
LILSKGGSLSKIRINGKENPGFMNRIVHIGFPKTGTTTLQQHLYPHHSQIQYLGKPYPSQEFQTSIHSLIMGESQFYDPARLKKLVPAPGFSPNGTPLRQVLSEELCVSTSKVRDKGLVAQRLKEIFFPCKILITIRSQPEILKSAYINGGRLLKDPPPRFQPYVMTFTEWLAASYADSHRSYVGSVDYYPIISFYSRLFGKDNLAVLLFEEYQVRPMNFIRRLAEFLDIDKEESRRLLEFKHENPSLRQSTLEYERLNRRLYPLSKFFVISKSVGVACRLKAQMKGNPKAKVDFSREWKDRLHRFYRQGNQNLAQEFDLPLEEYGFPL